MTSDNVRSEMWKKLKQLESFETYSPFCRVFYRLIYRLTRRSLASEQDFEALFAKFLDIEIDRHHRISTASEDGAIRMLDLVKIAGQTRKDIEGFWKSLQEWHRPTDPEVEMALRLLSAECCFYLGKTEKVIEELNEAVGLGCTHPIIFLALGFNTYCLALKRNATKSARRDQWKITNAEGFLETCQQAIEAFRNGLSGGGAPFDAQLHWWIGCISEIIGARADAIHAFKLAREIDPRGFGRDAVKRIEALAPSSLDTISEDEKVRLAALPKLTADDMQRASKWLQGIRTLDDLIRGRP